MLKIDTFINYIHVLVFAYVEDTCSDCFIMIIESTHNSSAKIRKMKSNVLKCIDNHDGFIFTLANI